VAILVNSSIGTGYNESIALANGALGGQWHASDKIDASGTNGHVQRRGRSREPLLVKDTVSACIESLSSIVANKSV
jgi:hypothetical protein